MAFLSLYLLFNFHFGFTYHFINAVLVVSLDVSPFLLQVHDRFTFVRKLKSLESQFIGECGKKQQYILTQLILSQSAVLLITRLSMLDLIMVSSL